VRAGRDPLRRGGGRYRLTLGPFEQHLRDAIALNRARAPRYAALSGGQSLAITRRLVLAERALLPVAWWFDRRAAAYHAAGIPLLEELFVSMEGAPAFAADAARPAGASTSMPGGAARAAAVRQRVLAAYRARGFDGAADALDAELAALAADPATDCLLRHLLESARRLAALAPVQIRMARERGLASPRWLLALLLRLHLRGLAAAAALDARAWPLQARGIGILARDLPPIPAPPRGVSGSAGRRA
jgi:hypothetical protein